MPWLWSWLCNIVFVVFPVLQTSHYFKTELVVLLQLLLFLHGCVFVCAFVFLPYGTMDWSLPIP